MDMRVFVLGYCRSDLLRDVSVSDTSLFFYRTVRRLAILPVGCGLGVNSSAQFETNF